MADESTPPRGVPLGAMLVGSLEEPSEHPRVRRTVDRLERTSSSQALGQAETLALVASQVVNMSANDADALAEAFHEPLRRWAAEARRGLIAHLERVERQTDELTRDLRRAAQGERWRRRHVDLRKRLAPLAEHNDEVRQALAEDR